MRKFIFAIFAVFVFFGCEPASQEVNVYSGRHYEIDEQLFQEFMSKPA